MTTVDFVKAYLPNYEERKNTLFRIHRDKSFLQWLNDKFPEAFNNFISKEG